MKLLLSTLQLASMCVLSRVSSELNVTQSEDVTVEEGHTANISCCWTDGNQNAKVIWKKTENIVKNETLNKSSCSFLELVNITKAHEGKYVCNLIVDIPILMKESGNGTVLTVKRLNAAIQKNNTSNTSFTLIGPAVVAPSLLVMLICFYCLRKKQVQAARVIYEVPHFDSETQEMDKHSTGSRGSSQWCQVTVYESFDYFEHTEAKKSG